MNILKHFLHYFYPVPGKKKVVQLFFLLLSDSVFSYQELRTKKVQEKSSDY